jgi:hypothetical protein
MDQWQRFAAIHATDPEIDDHDAEGEAAEQSDDLEVD